MKLFLVIRWGHDEAEEGPNGEDTNFIIRACDRNQAATLIDDFLRSCLHHSRVEPLCHRITELGDDTSSQNEPEIVCGPWYAYALWKMSGYKTWMREHQTDYEWVLQDEWFKGFNGVEPEAPPNGGPTNQLCNSDGTKGPPSVS